MEALGLAHTDYYESQLTEVAQSLIQAGGAASTWVLIGDLGAGKTTLIKALGQVWGITEAMSSPTFSIVNEYLLPNGEKLYHMDAYRLRKAQEALDIGWYNYVDSGQRLLIEWPQVLQDLLEFPYFCIILKAKVPERRTLFYGTITTESIHHAVMDWLPL